MKVIRIVGPSDSGTTTLVERLVDRLADRGRVGTIRHLDCEPSLDVTGTDTARHREAGATETYGIADDGGWVKSDADQTLTAALDELAVSCDYAVVEGYSGATQALPTVALGGADADDPLAAAPTADGIEAEAILDALEATDAYESLASLVARVKRSETADRAGAIATFTGRVREKDSPTDEPTEYLEFERYDEVAAEKMRAIREQLMARSGVYDVRLHHRTGVVAAGEDIVFVVVLAGHRREAFETVEDGIDRLKAEVPLFKKEVTVSGEFWAHQHDH